MDKIQAYLRDIALPDAFSLEDGMYKIADQSFNAMQGTIARMKLSAYPPDIEMKIPRNLCGTLEFNRVEKIIEYGYRKCIEVF